MKKTTIAAFWAVFIPLMFIGCSKDDDNETDAPKEHQSKGVEAVDLGLPSGTKWANMNVGASKPEDYGDYYAWGETEEKSYFSEENYAYYEDGKFVNIGDDIAGTEYDVAHVKWSGNWRMPTQAQIKELLKYTTWTWEQINGVRGMRFTATNGNSIFLPAAGYRWDDYLDDEGDYGNYWSSTQSPGNDDYADGLFFKSGDAGWSSSSYRYDGQSVRPVSK